MALYAIDDHGSQMDIGLRVDRAHEEIARTKIMVSVFILRASACGQVHFYGNPTVRQYSLSP